MGTIHYHLILLLTAVSASVLPAQTVRLPESEALCELQINAIQGTQQSVRVEGVYLEGMEGSFLVTSGCSNQSTDLEFSLATRHLVRKLVRLANKTNSKRHVSGDGDPVLVIFEGDFYGPEIPDPKLPNAIRRLYHPPWSNAGSFTKLVVHAIDSVKPLPADHPCAPKAGDRWPCLSGPTMLPKSLVKPNWTAEP